MTRKRTIVGGLSSQSVNPNILENDRGGFSSDKQNKMVKIEGDEKSIYESIWEMEMRMRKKRLKEKSMDRNHCSVEVMNQMPTSCD